MVRVRPSALEILSIIDVMERSSSDVRVRVVRSSTSRVNNTDRLRD